MKYKKLKKKYIQHKEDVLILLTIVLIFVTIAGIAATIYSAKSSKFLGLHAEKENVYENLALSSNLLNELKLLKYFFENSEGALENAKFTDAMPITFIDKPHIENARQAHLFGSPEIKNYLDVYSIKLNEWEAIRQNLIYSQKEGSANNKIQSVNMMLDIRENILLGENIPSIDEFIKIIENYTLYLRSINNILQEKINKLNP